MNRKQVLALGAGVLAEAGLWLLWPVSPTREMSRQTFPDGTMSITLARSIPLAEVFASFILLVATGTAIYRLRPVEKHE